MERITPVFPNQLAVLRLQFPRTCGGGISRRTTEACEFPPLRIEFKEKPGADSLFKGQKELKLATH